MLVLVVPNVPELIATRLIITQNSARHEYLLKLAIFFAAGSKALFDSNLRRIFCGPLSHYSRIPGMFVSSRDTRN